MPIPALTDRALVLWGTVHVGFALAVGGSIGSIHPTPRAVAMVVSLSVFIGVSGLVRYLVLMGEAGPLKANLRTYLTPLVALAIGWVRRRERIHP
jgi:drug/metabolite transporter (DMT)-like permease